MQSRFCFLFAFYLIETYIELWLNLYLSWYKLTSRHYNCDKVHIFCQSSEHSFKNIWGRFHSLEAKKKLNEGFLVYWLYSLLHQIIDIFTIICSKCAAKLFTTWNCFPIWGTKYWKTIRSINSHVDTFVPDWQQNKIENNYVNSKLKQIKLFIFFNLKTFLLVVLFKYNFYSPPVPLIDKVTTNN